MGSGSIGQGTDKRGGDMAFTWSGLKRAALMAAAVAALGTAAHADGEELGVKWSASPEFSADGYKFKVKGRIFYDFISGSGDVTAGAFTKEFDTRQTRARLLRIGVQGDISSSFKYNIELNSTRGSTTVTDATIEWILNPNTSIVVGNYKPFQSIEELTSDTHQTFMERSAFTGAFGLGRALGVGLVNRGEAYSFAVGAYGDDVNQSDPSASSLPTKERYQLNTRFTFMPVNTDTDKVHLGVWARYRNGGDSNLSAYTGKPGFDPGPSWVATSGFAKSDQTLGLELAWARPYFSLQGEYVGLKADNATSGGVDPSYKGYYIMGSWYLTGESRRYDATKGEFSRIKVLNPITAGGRGAWELAARYDVLDLVSDQASPTPAASPTLNSNGGEQKNLTLALNWWPISYVRVAANYVHSDLEDTAYGSGESNVFQTRLQIDF